MKLALAIALAATLGACGKKSETKDPAPTVGSGSGSGSAAPAGPAAKNTTDVTDNDKTLVINATGIDTKDITFNAPTGERVPVKVAVRADAKIDVTIGDKLFETIDAGVAAGDPKWEAVGSVVRIQNTVVVVAGARTKTAQPPTYKFDARVFTWDATGKQLALAKKIAFEHLLVPPPEQIDTHEHAGRP